MHLADTPKRFGDHRNAFGFLRLLFASLVIVSHVPEVVDNDAHREILARLTGTITFGNFAVYGFFVISGYLITGSLLTSRTLLSYFIKRCARLYPGFIVASLVCLVVVAPLSGASFAGGPLHRIGAAALHMVMLRRPTADHAFAGQNFSGYDIGLNGAMWTIQYEFACYLLIALLYVVGLFRGWLIVALAVALLAIGTAMSDTTTWWLAHGMLFSGPAASLFRLGGMFLSGAAWYLYRDRIAFPRLGLWGAAVGLAVASSQSSTVHLGFALFGGYLILAVARLGAGTWLERVNNRTDISYGVYVYAWLAEQLLIRYAGSRYLLLLGLGTWLIAVACGWLSWTLVERPALEWVRRRTRRSAARTAHDDHAAVPALGG